MKTNNDNIFDKTQEPSVSFKSFNSFHEMEQDELEWLASLSPEEHLQNATTLIKRVFSEQLKNKPTIGTRLYFD